MALETSIVLALGGLETLRAGQERAKSIAALFTHQGKSAKSLFVVDTD
ncbi:hypothetical protein L914_18934 [Phytophthora nicotianae]|uniref:Uncharacterized protein n=4 Tax=Phytophthora nicotianae TaxID=4792 RepID=V9ETE4_PHYNI|nr:hypothetical protein F443_13427 [Phytophthora nicotianae P1569]ETM33873.1 hypothetical protein L914_18934 [Phytophthora nicotianae]